MNTQNLKTEVKRIRLHHVVLLCAAVFVAFAILGSVLLAASGALRPHTNWSINNPLVGGERYEINENQPLDLSGVTEVVMKSVSGEIELKNGNGLAQLQGWCVTTGDPVKLVVNRSGSTLNVEVVYPKFNVNISSSCRLTVTLPADYAGDVQMHTVSGEILAGNMAQKLGHVRIETVSGDVDFRAEGASKLSVSTTSGEVRVKNAAYDIDAKTVSGEVYLDCAATGNLQAQTVSGEVAVVLPRDASCAVNFTSVSGDFRSTHSALGIHSADRGFQGNLGSGDKILRVSTTSGNFSIAER